VLRSPGNRSVDGDLAHDPARPRREDRDAGGQIGRFVDAVGNEDDGEPLAPPEVEQLVVQTPAGDLVERRERLVQQQEPRPGRERAGDRDPHPHPPGKLPRIGPREAAEPQPLQPFPDAAADLGARQAEELQGERHVPLHRRPRHERRLLENEAHRVRVRQAALHQTGGGSREPRHQAQRGALAAARGAEQGEELARSHSEVETGERLRAAGEPLGDPAQPEDRLRGGSGQHEDSSAPHPPAC
jgi:hypothetical protein